MLTPAQQALIRSASTPATCPPTIDIDAAAVTAAGPPYRFPFLALALVTLAFVAPWQPLEAKQVRTPLDAFSAPFHPWSGHWMASRPSAASIVPAQQRGEPERIECPVRAAADRRLRARPATQSRCRRGKRALGAKSW